MEKTRQMKAHAQVIFNRNYYAAMYDDWLVHRSVWRRYAIPIAFLVLATGIGLAVFRPQQPLPGLILAAIGLYEVWSSTTYRARWINRSVSDVRNDKMAEMIFDGDWLTTESVNGTANLRLGGFRGFVEGTNGFFLIPESGVSIYIQRTSVESEDAYESLVQALPDLVDTPPPRKEQSADESAGEDEDCS